MYSSFFVFLTLVNLMIFYYKAKKQAVSKEVMCACCIELQERDQYIFQGENKLRHFLDRELQLVEAMGQASRLGKARRPSAMARTGKEAERHGQDRLGGRAPRLVQARRPSAMVRTGKEAERHGQDRQGGRAPWLVQARRPSAMVSTARRPSVMARTGSLLIL